jgi:hypothetical protein
MHRLPSFADTGIEAIELVSTVAEVLRPHDEASAGSISMPHIPHTKDAAGLAQHA